VPDIVILSRVPCVRGNEEEDTYIRFVADIVILSGVHLLRDSYVSILLLITPEICKYPPPYYP